MNLRTRLRIDFHHLRFTCLTAPRIGARSQTRPLALPLAALSERSSIATLLVTAAALGAAGVVAFRLMQGPVHRGSPPPPEPPDSAGVSVPSVPTSERLETVRSRVEPRLVRQLEDSGFRLGDPVYLRIFKEEKILEAWIRDGSTGRFAHFRTYPIANWGRGTLGPKFREGDGQAPEGFYPVAPSQMNPRSDYHLSFNLGFPNAFDRHHGRTGSFLMVHGGDGSIGCYAVTDPQIEEIYLLVDGALRRGQPAVPVHCFPFRMSLARLRKAEATPEEGEFVEFWRNLKEAYDWFDFHGIPPEVNLDPASGRYRINSEIRSPEQAGNDAPIGG